MCGQMLFRQWVDAERAAHAQVKTRITIRRTHVIEDSLDQL